MNIDYNAQIKQLTDGGLLRSTPEAEGVPAAAVLKYFDELKRAELEVHSLMLLRNDKVLAEGWCAPYRAEYVHETASLSKSFTSTAVGMAVDRKLLSVEDRVLDYFPEYAKLADEDARWNKLTVRNLLRMSTGQLSEGDFRQDNDWVDGFFKTPLHDEPGQTFRYNSGATYMLAVIVSKVTGMDMFDWLQQELFPGLGITEVSSWKSPQGYACGGWGMNLRTVDIAKLGLLYLHEGIYNGKRLLSADWVHLAGKLQIDEQHCYGRGYGYQFWCSPHGSYNGNGMCGQFCMIIPESNCVLAVTAGLKNDMHKVLDLFWEHLYPHFGAALPEQPEQLRELQRALSEWRLPPLENNQAAAAQYAGKKLSFRLDENDSVIYQLRLNFDDQGGAVVFSGTGREMVLPFVYGCWNAAPDVKFGDSPVITRAAWKSSNEFLLEIAPYERMSRVRYDMTFDNQNLRARMTDSLFDHCNREFTGTPE